MLYTLSVVRIVSRGEQARESIGKTQEIIMKIRNSVALMMVAWLFTGATAIAADARKTSGVPMAVFESTTYHFPTVVDGVTIVHDFVLKNRGTADLKIEKVKTG